MTENDGVIGGYHVIKVELPKAYLEIAKGYKIPVFNVPNWFHRKMMKVVFGWNTIIVGE